VEDEDTEVGPAPRPNTNPRRFSIMTADTAEWDDTDREVEAQGTIDTTPQMFEDTGVVIIDKPVDPVRTDRLAITFRRSPPPVALKRPPHVVHPRATTAGEWPPPPREPATRAPQLRARTIKRAAVYEIVVRPDTQSS